jgi:hypothetical protein
MCSLVRPSHTLEGSDKLRWSNGGMKKSRGALKTLREKSAAVPIYHP